MNNDVLLETTVTAEVVLSGHNDVSQIRVSVSKEKLAILLAGLYAVQEGLAKCLLLNPKAKNGSLEICIDKDNPRPPDLLMMISNNFRVKLSNESFKYIVYFLLRYYRDGSSATDHVDVELDVVSPIFSSEGGRPYLTISLPKDEVRFASKGTEEALKILKEQS